MKLHIADRYADRTLCGKQSYHMDVCYMDVCSIESVSQMFLKTKWCEVCKRSFNANIQNEIKIK